MKFLKTSVLQLVAWLIVSGLGFMLITWQSKVQERTETQPVAQLPAKGVERLWFGPQGKLFLQTRDEREITVSSVSAPATSGQSISARQVGNFKLSSAGAADSLAVSLDGNRAAWLDGSRLRVHSFADQSGDLTKETDPASRLKRITWTDTGLLAVLNEDASLQILDAKDLSEHAGTTVPLQAPDSLAANGSFVAVGSSAQGDIRVYDTRSSPKLALIETRHFELGFRTMALSQSGRLAVNTVNGPILADTPLTGAGIVSGLVFLNENQLFAIRESGGLLLLGEGGHPVKLAETPVGTSAIACDTTDVAFSSPAGVVLLSYHHVPAMSDGVATVFRIWAGITIVLLVYYIVRGLMLLFVYVTGGRERSTVRVQGQSSLGEMDIPDDLLKALANDECIFAVGEDIASACGIPAWTPFVRMLVEWTADLQFFSDSEANMLRHRLAGGAANAIFRELSAVLADHRQSVIEFARSIYLKPAALSQVHEAIASLRIGGLLSGSLDRVLERAFSNANRELTVFLAQQSDLAIPALHNKEPFLLKLRGDWQTPESVVIEPSQAAKQNSAIPSYEDVLRFALERRSIVFVGMPLHEIDTWLGGIKLKGATRGSHYALIANNTGKPLKDPARLAARYSIKLLTYAPRELNQVCTFIEKMRAAQEIRSQVRTVGA
jgi:hypothetical protein